MTVGAITAATSVRLREHDAYLAALEELHAVTAGALAKAKEVGDLSAIGRLVTAAKGLIETAARLTGELRDVAPARVAVVLSWGDPPEAPALDARLIASAPGSAVLEAPGAPERGEPSGGDNVQLSEVRTDPEAAS